MEDYKNDLHHVISQMMFVSGETADPSVEATSLIEKIVHAQVVEMVRLASFYLFQATYISFS